MTKTSIRNYFPRSIKQHPEKRRQYFAMAAKKTPIMKKRHALIAPFLWDKTYREGAKASIFRSMRILIYGCDLSRFRGATVSTITDFSIFENPLQLPQLSSLRRVN